MLDYFAHQSSYIDDGSLIGRGTKIWHFSHIMPGAIIGEDCNIGQNVVISPGVIIGDKVKIQNNVSVYTGVECEEGVFLGPSCVFTNVINPRSLIEKKDEYKKTILKKGASVGANATIICGNIIGKFALIGAGAVVTKNVGDYELFVGNPAKKIGYICECGERLHNNNKEIYKCYVCNKRYKLKNNTLREED